MVDNDSMSSGRMKLAGRPRVASRYKGVIPQPNNRWGAQIYVGQTRLWLGTYRTEVEAAKMHDIGVYKLKGNQCSTNFERPFDELETCFIASRTESQILEMIRSHTYYEELQLAKEILLVSKPYNDRDLNGSSSCDHLIRSSMRKKIMTCKDVGQDGNSQYPVAKHRDDQMRILFEKVLTPSDVGKLNRLVIPKKYAEMYFPELDRRSDAVTLSFEEEMSGRIWCFKYSVWESSNSFVLTKGWKRFVVDKRLSAGDSVTFGRSSSTSRSVHVNYIIGSRTNNCLVHSPDQPGKLIRLFGVDISSEENSTSQ